MLHRFKPSAYVLKVRPQAFILLPTVLNAPDDELRAEKRGNVWSENLTVARTAQPGDDVYKVLYKCACLIIICDYINTCMHNCLYVHVYKIYFIVFSY